MHVILVGFTGCSRKDTRIQGNMFEIWEPVPTVTQLGLSAPPTAVQDMYNVGPVFFQQEMKGPETPQMSSIGSYHWLAGI